MPTTLYGEFPQFDWLTGGELAREILEARLSPTERMIYSPATTVAGGFFCAQKYPADAAQFPAPVAETRENNEDTPAVILPGCFATIQV